METYRQYILNTHTHINLSLPAVDFAAAVRFVQTSMFTPLAEPSGRNPDYLAVCAVPSTADGRVCLVSAHSLRPRPRVGGRVLSDLAALPVTYARLISLILRFDPFGIAGLAAAHGEFLGEGW